MKRRFKTLIRIGGYSPGQNGAMNTYVSRGIIKATWLDVNEEIGAAVADIVEARMTEAKVIRNRTLKEAKAQQEETERQARSLSGRVKALLARMRL